MLKEKQRLNILMVTPRYFPDMGGIETHVYEVGRRLVKSGVNVTLLTTLPHNHANSVPREEEIEGMHIIRVQKWLPQSDYYIAPAIRSFIMRGKWDLIHCQGCHTFVPPLAMLAANAAKIPYIVTFHSGGHSSQFRNQIRTTQWRLLRPLFVNAAKLIGVSRSEADYFRNILHFPDYKFSVIPNGATIPIVENSSRDSTRPMSILSIGRLERYKGHQHMITAFPKIREYYPGARLLILGKGPYETALRELAQRMGISECVEIRAVPPEERQTMAEMVSQAALVTLLSEYEAHPVAVIEALALRRPVLVADAPGLRELAEQRLVRAVSLKSSPEEIAQVAIRQIEDPIIPPAGFRLPTWDDCAQQLQEQYQTVVGNYSSVF
jgi:glycosyltransferase involved in cell wall biosynthesis